MGKIANKNLTLIYVPRLNASWRKIAEFALTFNGYETWGLFKKCTEIANGQAAGIADGLTNVPLLRTERVAALW